MEFPRLLISAVLCLGLTMPVQLEKSTLLDDVFNWVRPRSTMDALQEALKEDTRYLYAEVTSEMANSSTASTSPVLADDKGHMSNTSLIQWLDTIIRDQKNVKGIKLILLETDVFAPVVKIVQSRRDNMSDFLVYIGADVLPGPVVSNIPSPQPQADVQKFLDVIVEGLPWVILSVGWTVPSKNVTDHRQVDTEGEYTWEDVRDMALLWNCRGVTNRLTFEVWTPLVMKSISKIQWLAKSFANSTINIWNINNNPPLNMTAILEALHNLKDVPLSFELPSPIYEDMISNWDTVDAPSVVLSPTFEQGNSITLPDNNFNNGMKCILRPYITSDTLLVNGYETQAVLFIKRYQTPAKLTGNLHVLDSLMDPQHKDMFTTVSGIFTVFAVESNELPHDLSTTETDKLFQVLLSTESVNASCTVRSNMSTDIEDDDCPLQIRLEVEAGHGTSVVGYTCEGSTPIENTTSHFEGDYVVFGFLFSGWSGFVFDNVTIEVPNASLKILPSLLSACACTLTIMLYSRNYY